MHCGQWAGQAEFTPCKNTFFWIIHSTGNNYVSQETKRILHERCILEYSYSHPMEKIMGDEWKYKLKFILEEYMNSGYMDGYGNT
jgi:hypothetical protein